MASPFETIEREVVAAIPRLALQNPAPRVLARAEDRLTGFEQEASFSWHAPDDRPGFFGRGELERARDFASDLARTIDEHAYRHVSPSVRWAVALNFRRYTPAYATGEWRLEVRWALVLDPTSVVS